MTSRCNVDHDYAIRILMDHMRAMHLVTAGWDCPRCGEGFYITLRFKEEDN